MKSIARKLRNIPPYHTLDLLYRVHQELRVPCYQNQYFQIMQTFSYSPAAPQMLWKGFVLGRERAVSMCLSSQNWERYILGKGRYGKGTFWEKGIMGKDNSRKGTFWEKVIMGKELPGKGTFWEKVIMGKEHSGKGTFWEMAILGKPSNALNPITEMFIRFVISSSRNVHWKGYFGKG